MTNTVEPPSVEMLQRVRDYLYHLHDESKPDMSDDGFRFYNAYRVLAKLSFEQARIQDNNELPANNRAE